MNKREGTVNKTDRSQSGKQIIETIWEENQSESGDTLSRKTFRFYPEELIQNYIVWKTGFEIAWDF